MVPRDPGRVVRLHPSAAEVRRARRQVQVLVQEALEDLLAVGDDLQHIHGAFLSIARAVRLTVRYGLDVDQEVAS